MILSGLNILLTVIWPSNVLASLARLDRNGANVAFSANVCSLRSQGQSQGGKGRWEALMSGRLWAQSCQRRSMREEVWPWSIQNCPGRGQYAGTSATFPVRMLTKVHRAPNYGSRQSLFSIHDDDEDPLIKDHGMRTSSGPATSLHDDQLGSKGLTHSSTSVSKERKRRLQGWRFGVAASASLASLVGYSQCISKAYGAQILMTFVGVNDKLLVCHHCKH